MDTFDTAKRRVQELEAEVARLNQMLDARGTPSTLRHQTRNALGLMRSIIRHSAAQKSSVQDYAAHLEGRFDALLRVESLLIAVAGSGADLRTIVTEELLAHLIQDGGRATIGGPKILLRPIAAEKIALAIHELVVNAVKFGAMTVPTGMGIGMLGLHSADSNGTTSPLEPADLLAEPRSVVALAIDSLVPARQRIDVVKIDVEGAEYLALQGCENTLRRWQPFLVSELSPALLAANSGIDALDYLHWLLDLDYRIGVITREGKVSPPGGDPALIMAHYEASGVDHIDIACLPPDMPFSVVG